MKSEAFRDDLAAAHAYGAPTYFKDHPGPDWIWLGPNLWSKTQAARARDANTKTLTGSELIGHVHVGGTTAASLEVQVAPETQLQRLCTDMTWRQICEVISLRRRRGRTGRGAHTDLPTLDEAIALGWIEGAQPQLINVQITPATPKQKAARVSDLVTIIVNVVPSGIPFADLIADNLLAGMSVLDSDRPGIAAMAAKNVKPAPEPVLSIAGQKATAAEFAQALQAVRAKSAPAVKEVPRGLMTIAAMDHRLGRWNEA